MNLRQELEILRGEPILDKVQASAVPYNETSDSSRLCNNPVVSVRMITYNHEKYIAQAIDGVMMQQTDFEYELIISDDCSTDRTHQIAEEYQKRYPDKIRVLWWTENQFKFGGNGLRAWVACRGEFVALCEGDDYWIDPLKLQKQVDVMRRYPKVSLCVGNIRSLIEEKGTIEDSHMLNSLWREGVTARDVAFAEARWLPTCTILLRKSIYEKARQDFEIFNWRLMVGDVLLWNAMSYYGDIYVSYEYYGVYRSHPGGATRDVWAEIVRDSGVITSYFALKTGGKSIHTLYTKLMQIVDGRCRLTQRLCYAQRKKAIDSILTSLSARTIAIAQYGIVGLYLMRLGRVFWFAMRIRDGIRRRLTKQFIKYRDGIR